MTTRFTLRAAAIGLAVSGLLAVAACGGDDDSADTTATEQTADATTAPGDSATTVAGSDATTSGDIAADCRELAEEFANALGGAANPTADPEEIAGAFSRLAENVPADLRDDVELVGDALGTYAEVYAKVADDPTKAATDPDVLAALQELATPEYTAATQAVSTYFTETCQPG
jgi:hypothetical protein